MAVAAYNPPSVTAIAVTSASGSPNGVHEAFASRSGDQQRCVQKWPFSSQATTVRYWAARCLIGTSAVPVGAHAPVVAGARLHIIPAASTPNSTSALLTAMEM